MVRQGAIAMLAAILLCGCGREPSEPAAAPPPPPPPNAALQVNGRFVTRDTINRELQRDLRRINPNTTPEVYQKLQASMRNRIIDQTINGMLLVDAARDAKFVVTPAELETEFAAYRTARRLPSDTALSSLPDAQDVIEHLTSILLIRRYVDSHMPPMPPITETQIADYASKEWRALAVAPDTVWARHMQISISAGDTEEAVVEKKQLAHSLRRQILDGADFDALARQHSSCRSRHAGGYLGAIRRGDLLEPLNTTLFSQQPGKLGEVIQSEKGFHFFLVERKTERGTAPREEIIAALKDQYRRDTMKGIVARLREKATIEVY